MLVNLTPNLVEIERCMKIATEEDFEYIPQSHPQWLQETGIYQSSFSYNFHEEVFMEKLCDYNEISYEKNKKDGETLWQFQCRKHKNHIVSDGVADNIEQIKSYYKNQVKSKKDKFIIVLTPVWQELENKGKGGGWRWHKWGKYIGVLDKQCEYLDDEEFGADFKYILCFTLYHVE